MLAFSNTVYKTKLNDIIKQPEMAGFPRQIIQRERQLCHRYNKVLTTPTKRQSLLDIPFSATVLQDTLFSLCIALHKAVHNEKQTQAIFILAH